MAQFILESGADVESTDLEGRTPLHVTAWQGHSHMVSLLLGHGSKVDAIDTEHRTPLQSAAWQGHAEIVRLLLESGAKVDHTCSQGATALSIASQEGHQDCVAILLQYGANPSHSDRCGRTAIKVALKGGHLHLARMLEEQMVEIQQHGLAGHHNRVGASSVSVGSASTAETKPCSALLCPPLATSPADSPESTFEKRRSCTSLGQHSSSKSSGNLTTSTRSSGGGAPPIPHTSLAMQHHAPPPAPSAPPASAVLSFTQQLQQCGGRARASRNRHNQPFFSPPTQQLPLTPLDDEPSSPIYASPPQSPLSDGGDFGGGRNHHLPQRVNPVVALLEEEYSLPLHHSGARRPLPSAPPAAITPEVCLI